MKYPKYSKASFSERSFRDLLKNIPNFKNIDDIDFNRKNFIHEFKNMVYHSFIGRNLFSIGMFNHGKVKFKQGILPNSLSEEVWDDIFDSRKVYVPKLDAICIPIRTNNFIQARLLIASPPGWKAQFALQTRVSGSRHWGTHHCTPGTVKSTIDTFI